MGFYGNATYYLPNGIAQDIMEGVVVETKLADDAVTTKKIKNGSVTAEKIGLNVIKGGPAGTGHLAVNTITKDNMDKNSVDSDQIVDRSVTTNKIAEEAIVGGEKGNIAKETITGGDSETKGNIAPNTIQQYNMADNSVGTDQIINDSINSYKIEDYQIHGSGNKSEFKHIADKSIGEQDIADNAITHWKIRRNSVVGKNGDLKDNYSNKTISHIWPESITGGEDGDIAPNTITNYNMADNSILTANIGNGSITTEKLANEAIIPNKLDRTYHEMHLIDLTYYNQIEYSQLAQFITEKYLETKNTAICFHSRPNHLDKLKDAPSGYYKITYAGEIYGSEQSTTYWWKLEILSQKAANPPEEQQTTLYFVFNHDSTDSQTKYSNFKLIPASTWVLRNYLRDNQQNKEVKFDQINTILSNFPLSDSNKNYLTYIQVIEKTESLSEEKNDLRFWWNPIRLESDSTSPQAGDYILLGNPNRQAYYLFGINNSKHYILFCRTESGQDVWFTKEIKNNEDSVIKTLTNYGPSGSSMSDITLLNNIHYDLIEDDNYITRKNYYIKENTNNYFSQKCTLVTKYSSTDTIIKNLTNSVILLDLQGNKQTVVQDGSFNFPEGFPTECILYLNFKRLSNNYIYCECKYW